MKDHIGFISKPVKVNQRYVTVTWCALDGAILIPLRTNKQSIENLEYAHPKSITTNKGFFALSDMVRKKKVVTPVKCPHCDGVLP